VPPDLPVPPAINHGNTSGSKILSSNYGVHELNLTNDVVITPSGASGQNFSARITLNGHALELAGCAWDGGVAPASFPEVATLVFIRYATGWYAYATGVAAVPDVEATPEDVTFNDFSNTTTVPAVTGVQYKRNGVNVAAGEVASEPEGLVTYTAVAKAGYVLAVGAPTSWPHTYSVPSGWVNYIVDSFTGADGTIAGHVPDTTPDGTPWATDGTDFVGIASNHLAHPSGSYNPIATMDIPVHVGGDLGVAIDVDMNQMLDTSAPVFQIPILSVDNNDGVTLTLTWVEADDSITVTAINGNGHGPVTLTGTTTSLPTTGRYGLRFKSDLSISILLDEEEIATGTAHTATYGFDIDRIGLYMTMCKNSTFDNFVVEEFVG
jgi:hypothetical protein